MATPPISDVPEVEEHYLAQFAIVAALAAAARELWPILNPADLEGTFPTVARGLAALTEEYSRASISVAADHYADLRASKVPGGFSVPVIDAPSPSRILTTLDQIGETSFAEARAIPDDLFLAEITASLARGAGVTVESIVADAASDEIFAAIRRDDQAQGWARITRPGACYFCRMLASRGAVYYTERSGSFRAHAPKNGRGGTCRCTVEAQFAREYEPTAQARADAETWERVTAGLSGPDAIDAFRRSLEGREDGPHRRRRRRGDRAAPKSTPSRSSGWKGFDAMTPSELRHDLAVVEALPDSDYRTGQIERLRNRLAELGD